ncbi:MAG: hypothetical protein DME50_08065 [Verrucomicrobia bacterium]|nr:MAG: hypothetical protein DME78_03595 [Verrucomicrobiota bacterium]PYK65654.1 MAG: hypothetical protein DME50_08065 [Verrucomicrobiota bacterium]
MAERIVETSVKKLGTGAISSFKRNHRRKYRARTCTIPDQDLISKEAVLQKSKPRRLKVQAKWCRGNNYTVVREDCAKLLPRISTRSKYSSV